MKRRKEETIGGPVFESTWQSWNKLWANQDLRSLSRVSSKRVPNEPSIRIVSRLSLRRQYRKKPHLRTDLGCEITAWTEGEGGQMAGRRTPSVGTCNQDNARIDLGWGKLLPNCCQKIRERKLGLQVFVGGPPRHDLLYPRLYGWLQSCPVLFPFELWNPLSLGQVLGMDEMGTISLKYRKLIQSVTV